jgi:hypothetical protein
MTEASRRSAYLLGTGEAVALTAELLHREPMHSVWKCCRIAQGPGAGMARPCVRSGKTNGI